ncbi:MAG: AsnC family transcriptional regulator [Methanocellales archaeon]|nr:AsnC family transcriptional regulator [Methanocellales archaeon]MDD3291939.1 AsnC family transcriptional regulator [Methanocellales archaeon]MDD5235660.1 AsnC family transcriptional regulator [Methanocellales archaeon]MDD5485507.1 AsnC family transcriptional regulator [Methanocellales archaeon]
MDDMDVKLLKLTQDGIPLIPTPFAEIATSLGISEEEVTTRLKKLRDTGIIHRFGASIAHRRVGIVANAMCVWAVPSERVDEVGGIIASFDEVTHCYERLRSNKWGYNVFAMVHGHDKEECKAIAERIAEATGIYDYEMLFSERELKKVGLQIE